MLLPYKMNCSNYEEKRALFYTECERDGKVCYTIVPVQ